MRAAPIPAEPARLPKLRAIRRFWPRTSELMRPTDRIEKAALGLAVLAAMMLLPVALAIGSETYARGAQLAQQQGPERQQAVAILSEAAPQPAPTMHSGLVAQTSPVAARWTLPDGSIRTGTVAATSGSPSGTRVPIWLDRAGNVVPPPVTPAGATGAGVVTAIGLWAVGLTAFAGLYLLVRLGLDRYRLAGWQREWAAAEPGWTHRPS